MKITGLNMPPIMVARLINGTRHSPNCPGKLSLSYTMTRDSKPEKIVIGCPDCSFRIEFEGDPEIEVDLDIKIIGKERK